MAECSHELVSANVPVNVLLVPSRWKSPLKLRSIRNEPSPLTLPAK